MSKAHDMQRALEVAAAISQAHFGLVALMEAIHGEGAFSSGRRALLMNLRELGAQTAPNLARMRPVSRQYVQKLMDELLAEGLVERRENPAHRRSCLYALTPQGEAHVAAIEAREAPILAALTRNFDPVAAATTLAFLRASRAAIDAEISRLAGENPS